MSVCAGPGCRDQRCGHEIPRLAEADKLRGTLGGRTRLRLLTEPSENLTAPTRAELDAGLDLTSMTEAAATYAEALDRVGADLVRTLGELDLEAVQRALLQAGEVERGTRVNPHKDRRLRGKARVKARRAR